MSVTRDFDVERVSGNGNQPTPSTFTVGGEKFTVKEYVSADVLAEFGNRDVAHMGDVIGAYDRFIKQVIAEADGKKWEQVRAEADPPLTVGAIEKIVWWLMEIASGRPTEAPSSSRRGRATPAAT